MNEDLKNKLNESAADLIAWVEKNGTAAEDFVKEQTPLLIGEILDYYYICALISTIFWALFSISTFVLVGISFPKLKRFVEKMEDDFPPLHYLMLIIVGFLELFVISELSQNLYTLIKISVAPRLFIIEQIKEMI